MDLATQIKNCTKCLLHTKLPDGCTPVSGIGPINAKLMFVAEAPGADEIIIGEPLVGQCGQLFDKMLKDAGIDRNDCYISNIVHCRPTDTGKKNRAPNKTEINACINWIFQEIDLVKPKIIVTMGKTATYALLSSQLTKSFKLGPICGQVHHTTYTNAKIIPLLHPSAIMVYSRSEMNRMIDFLKMIKIMVNDDV